MSEMVLSYLDIPQNPPGRVPNSPGGVQNWPEGVPDGKTGASYLGHTNDGLQGSTTWILGSDRIEQAVGRAIAPDVRQAFGAGRAEVWVVTTRADGATEIQILDAFGKPKPIDTSRILVPGTNLSGAQP
jgi:filamentous hemagglutinin